MTKTLTLNRMLEIQDQSNLCGDFLDWFNILYLKEKNRENPFMNVMEAGDYINKENCLTNS